MSIAEISVAGVLGLVAGGAGREIADRVMDLFTRNDSSSNRMAMKTAYWKESVRGVVSDAIVPIIAAQNKTLEDLLAINRHMNDGITELCAITRERQKNV